VGDELAEEGGALLERERLDGAEQLHLGGDDGGGGERGGRLHREPHEGLQQVVLDDVADDAELVKVSAAPARAQVLLEGKLHRLDVGGAPDGLKELVAPAERGDVENHLLAEVVVKPEELALVEVPRRQLVELLERLRVAPERLLNHQPREAAGARAAVLGEHLRHRAKDGRGHREEVEAVAGGAVLIGGHPGVEPRVRLGRVVPARVKSDPRGEVGLWQPRVLLDIDALLLDEGGQVDHRASVADDVDVPRQVAQQAELVQRRKQLLPREVAGCAKQHDGQRHRHQRRWRGELGRGAAGLGSTVAARVGSLGGRLRVIIKQQLAQPSTCIPRPLCAHLGDRVGQHRPELLIFDVLCELFGYFLGQPHADRRHAERRHPCHGARR